MQLFEIPAAHLAPLYRKRQASPVEVLESILSRIDAVEPRFNTFRIVDRHAAHAQARAAERRWLNGTPLGALDGVPVAFKDLLDVQWLPTRRGSLATRDTPANSDSPAAARLRDAGALLLGKTNTAEFGWSSLTETALAGVTRNPRNSDYSCSGSSGGAAAAAGLGLGPLHVGTDGGGSIRAPAAACGVFGFKPTFGRVPQHPPAYNRSLLHVGPITRTVTDAALLLNTLSQPDPRDDTALPWDGRDYLAQLDAGIRGLRVAYSRTLGLVKVDARVTAKVDAAAKIFADLGAHVEEVDPKIPDQPQIYEILAAERALRLLNDIPAQRFGLIDAQIRASVERAQAFSLRDYVTALDQRRELCEVIQRFHERYELLLTPVLEGLVPRTGEPTPTRLCAPFNLTRQPAASIPVGFDENRLPIGLQIVAAYSRDDLVLRAARAFEIAQPFPLVAQG